MNDGSALSALIGAGGAVVAVVVSYLLTRTATKRIEVTVNHRLDEALRFAEELKEDLREAGLEVPKGRNDA